LFSSDFALTSDIIGGTASSSALSFAQKQEMKIQMAKNLSIIHTRVGRKLSIRRTTSVECFELAFRMNNVSLAEDASDDSLDSDWTISIGRRTEGIITVILNTV
jgi:hypothetical protein